MITFSEVLESAEQLPTEDKEELIQTLRRRLSEQRRHEILVATEQGRQEHTTGMIKPQSADAIVDSLEA